MKKFILSIALFLLFSFNSFGHVNHYAKYNYLEYELLRNNKPIGYHKYDFIRDGDNVIYIGILMIILSFLLCFFNITRNNGTGEVGTTPQ